jgi:tryptophan synthase alpha chain
MTELLGNNLLVKKFKELSEKNERGLICYVLPGYPNYDYTNKNNNDDYHDHNNTTLQIVSAMVEAGADIIELAIPFSDPIADGPILQEASYQSLKAGTTPQMCLKIAQKIRTRYPQLPILVITYSNILFKLGLENFIKKSCESGINGFIIPDMSIEEADEYINEASRLELATIFLASPNTNEIRLRSIASKSSGFLYLVSVYGTTGIRKSIDSYTTDIIKNVKRTLGKTIPIAVGFGISKPLHGKVMINAGADAIIVASALINIINETKDNNNNRQMLEQIRYFVASMKKVCRKENRHSKLQK